MINELNRELFELKKDMLIKDITLKRILDIEKEIFEKKNRIVKFKNKLLLEKRDVERLEKYTLHNLYFTLAGGKQEKLSKEKAEYLNIKVKYDRLTLELDVLKKEKRNQNELVEKIDLNTDRYQFLISEKKKIILEISGDISYKLNNLILEEDIIAKNLIEVEEAYREGKNLKETINKLKIAMKAARKWGTIDLFTNKSLIISLAKYNKIADANVLITKMKLQLRRFEKELNDVNNMIGNIDLSFSSMTMTFDILFDNIFTDFKVRNEIDAINRQLIIIFNKVQKIFNNLEVSIPKMQKELKEMNQEIENIVINH